MTMIAAPYKEFVWNSTGAGNGRSGEGLAEKFVEVVSGVGDVESICDLGCGNGYMAGRLALKGYRVTGIDASQSGIVLARENYPNVTFINSLIDAKLRERADLAQFDLVLSSDVIEHLYRPSDLIEGALALLKPNGRIVIGTPYHGYFKNLILAVTGRLDPHFDALEVGGHIKFFSVATLSRLLRDYSFRDLKFSFYGRAPLLWMNMICSAQKTTD